MDSEQQKTEREFRNLRRQGVSQAQERERLLEQVRMMEEENDRQMQELVAKHEQQLQQVYALHTQRSTRDGPQPIDRDQARVIEHHGGEMSQRSLVEDDGASENWETVSHASSKESVFIPGQYRVPERLNRTEPIQVNVQLGGSPMQDRPPAIHASKKTELRVQNEEGKVPEHQPRDKEEEIRILERRLSLLEQQGCYPIDTEVEVIEPDNDKKERAYQRKPSFLNDSYSESEEITPLKSQTKLDQRTQRLEDCPPVKVDRFTDGTNRIQYETDERTSHYGYSKSNEVRNELQQKEVSTPVQRRDVRAKERQYHYIQPPEEATAYTNRTQYHRQEGIEQTEQREMSSNRFQDDKGEHSLLIQRRRVEDNLRAWEEELRRKEKELIEREERLVLQERRKQEACQLREKENELRRRMKLLQIREQKLSQGEASIREDKHETEQPPIGEEFPMDFSQEAFQRAENAKREPVRDSIQKTRIEHPFQEEYPMDLSQKMNNQRAENQKREAVTNIIQTPEVECYPMKEETAKGVIQRDNRSTREPSLDTVQKTVNVNTEIQPLARPMEHHTEIETQDTNKGNEKHKVLDWQYSFPKFSPFSGEDPKPKSEASFEEWRYEVNCTRDSGDYSESMVAQAIRKSLRSPAKKVLLPLGTAASVDTMMDKLEGVFGNVAKGQSVLKEFYTAAQLETETVTAWGLRLEEILQKAIEKGYVRKEQRNNMLKEQFWTALRSERLKNATRVKYEFTEDFELLRRAVRAEEYDMNQFSSLRQHQAGSSQHRRPAEEEKLTENSKLDQLIEGIQTLTKEVKAGNKRTRFRPWFNKEEQQEGNTNTETTQEKNKHPLNH